MKDWADEAFARLQKRDGATQHDIENRRQIMSDAPYLWDELAAKLNAGVKSFSVLQPNELRIADESKDNQDPFIGLASSICKVTVNYNQGTPRITYSATAQETNPIGGDKRLLGKGSFIFEVKGGKVWIHTEQGEALTVDAVARVLLNYLI